MSYQDLLETVVSCFKEGKIDVLESIFTRLKKRLKDLLLHGECKSGVSIDDQIERKWSLRRLELSTMTKKTAGR